MFTRLKDLYGWAIITPTSSLIVCFKDKNTFYKI